MNSLIRNLKKIREDRKVSYSMLERSVGISASKLREAEEEELQLTIGELDRLMAYYRMTPRQVLHYKKRRWGSHIVKIAAVLSLLIIGFYVLGNGMFSPNEQSAAPAEQGLESDQEIDGQNSDELDQEIGSQNSDELDQEIGSQNSDELDRGINQSFEEEPEQGIDQSSDGELEQGADHNSDGAMERGLGIGSEEDQSEGLSAQNEAVFRFWGNVPYDTDQLPMLDGNDHSNITHIIPIEQLSNARPEWLNVIGKERLLLNIGTADIWTPTTIEELRQLQEDGIPVIGLGQTPQVYEPHIVQIADQKVGFLSLAGLIHEAEHIAYPARIGLPRAYDNEEVRTAVEEAKSKVDYLFVLIHWGHRRGDEVPIAKQERLAGVIAEAGGDFVIGNRPLRSQDITAIDGVPIFYSLGHSISQDADDGLTNFVLDVHFSSELIKVVVKAGTMQDGVIQFEAAIEDLEKLQAEIDSLQTDDLKFEL